MAPDDVKIRPLTRDTSKLTPVRLAIADYDRTRPLIDGRVQPEGISLTTANPDIAEFCNRPVYEEFDLAEMSFSLFVAAKDRGDPVVVLPIFPLRMAVLAYVFCRADAPYRSPADLKGKRIASVGYRYTVNLWLRGIFQDRYGLAPEDVTWVLCQNENAGFKIPPGIKFEVHEGRTPGDLLLSGDADAVIGPEAPDEWLNGDTRLRRIFLDPKVECSTYSRDVGFFPVTHIVAMSEASYKSKKWVAESMLQGFRDAFRTWDEFVYANAKHSIFPDAVFFLEEERRVWGPHAWPHGIEGNRKMIETFVRYAHEQHYIKRRLTIEEMFAENTLKL